MYSFIIFHPGRIERIKLTLICYNRTCTDRFFPFLIYTNSYRIMFPSNKIFRSAQRPLMTTQPTQTCMMTFIQEPINIKCTFIIIRHTVTCKQMAFYRFKILYSCNSLNSRIVILYYLCKHADRE